MAPNRMKLAAVVLALCAAGARGADDEELPPPLTMEQFPRLFDAVKPYAGEWRWREDIPWVGTIHEARLRAAKEDKPILAWQSANSPPLGST